jgi:hypothetical protein
MALMGYSLFRGPWDTDLRKKLEDENIGSDSL